MTEIQLVMPVSVKGSYISSAGIRVHQNYQKKGIATQLISKRNIIFNLINMPTLLKVNTTVSVKM